jgi:hypothetical protein
MISTNKTKSASRLWQEVRDRRMTHTLDAIQQICNKANDYINKLMKPMFDTVKIK